MKNILEKIYFRKDIKFWKEKKGFSPETAITIGKKIRKANWILFRAKIKAFLVGRKLIPDFSGDSPKTKAYLNSL
jgi:hypothetical protein